MQSQTEEPRQGERNPFNVVHDDLANYSPSCQCCKSCKRSNEHRARVNGHGEQYIFAGERRGTPLNLALRRFSKISHPRSPELPTPLRKLS
jgi:hypothetical protein